MHQFTFSKESQAKQEEYYMRERHNLQLVSF